MNLDLNASYILTADVDLDGFSFSPVGDSSDPFTGTLDGDGFTISNLSVGGQNQEEVGLFGATSGATILDLTLEEVEVTGIKFLGAIVGWARENTSITNCEVTDSDGNADIVAAASITASSVAHIGGIVGQLEISSMAGCTAAVEVDATNVSGKPYYNVGGLIGHCHPVGSVTEQTTVSACSASGAVTGIERVGGLIGNVHGTAVSSSVASGDVEGTGHVGGLAGYMQFQSASVDTIITGSTASGVVLATSSASTTIGGQASSVGGLVGWQEDKTTIGGSGAFDGCSASGNVTHSGSHNATFVVRGGGLVGHTDDDCLVEQCDATGNVSVEAGFAGGLVGWTLTGVTITDCTVDGASQSKDGDIQTGGITGGLRDNSLITGCYVGAGVSVNANGRIGNGFSDEEFAAVGGIVGYLFPNATVEKSGSAADVSAGGEWVGGAVGLLFDGDLDQVYATGDVSSDHDIIGGLVGGIGDNDGDSRASNITDSFAHGDVTHSNNGDYVGGLIGLCQEDEFLPRCRVLLFNWRRVSDRRQP